MRNMIGMMLLGFAGVASAQAADQCASLAGARSQVAGADLILPLAPELAAPSYRPGAPSGVLAQALDEILTVEQVLLRRKLDACMLAKAMPASTPGLPAATDPATYKPKTEFDNTPWRFDMNQNGKRMTADEFSAWMKARGVRVARGAAPAAASADSPAQAPAEAAPEPKAD
ncbi:hypothetical protein ACFFGH_05460 [Lysobacter korlensis]|uniref:Secreted protein n=1 Tax=Lysobacter korlensis TaxID=553636 RepID=A0ABV6RJY3_9GAMM